MSTAEMEVTGAVTERLFGSLLGALELATVHLGVRWACTTSWPPRGPRRRSRRRAASTSATPASGWSSRRSAGWSPSSSRDAESRVYGLDPEQAASFGDPESPAYAGSMALLMGGVAAVAQRPARGLPLGAGIAFGGYGDDVRLGKDFQPRGFLAADPGVAAAFPGVTDLLSRPGARRSTWAAGSAGRDRLATAYPGLEVLGIDSDDASVMDARANAAETGLGDRVRFEVADAAAPPDEGGFDVAFYFEALHDLAHPVESLTAVRGSLRPGGVVVVVEEGAEEEFAPNGSEIERVLATSSVLHCLPVGRSQPGSEGTGALFRPSTMRSTPPERVTRTSRWLPSSTTCSGSSC